MIALKSQKYSNLEKDSKQGWNGRGREIESDGRNERRSLDYADIKKKFYLKAV